ncbi:hypothetical protein B0J12DRAFT_587225 [Macrophomina phaseolina]|uniref:Rhodopsin domain-containing protein n=1 Tax=Macrophomina phaseolina TaxID=35725 RepID=A0ABQ8FPY0_9PEZI|nr:hypothetical protein B0J12DRAFT_587225 [Macrophomina phaseolina]
MNSSSQVVGAFPPPPGVTPNFTNTVSIAFQVTLSAALAPVFAVPICILRLYTKKYIIKRVDPEDSSLLSGTLMAVFGVELKNGVGRHIWDVPLPVFKRFIITGVPAGLAYAFATLFTKVSLAQFYIRLSPDTNFKIGAYIVMFVSVCYNLLGGFCFLFFCRPIHKLWDYTVPGHCINMGAAFLSTAAVNTATDISLLLLPIWLLWGLHLPVKKKIGVVLVLMAGSFVCAVSIIRLAIIPSGMKNPDITWNYVRNLMWCIIETYVGIICTCLPSLWTFARHHFPRLFPQATNMAKA